MNKNVLNMLMASSLLHTNEYSFYYIDDEKVNECIMDMYFYMLYNGADNEEKKEEYFKEFETKYDKLNKEQQDIVKKEYIDIIETQNRNREKEKVKKKGMRDYE